MRNWSQNSDFVAYKNKYDRCKAVWLQEANGSKSGLKAQSGLTISLLK